MMDEALELDMKEFLKVLAKRAWIIILCAVITGAAVLAYTVKFVTPMYQAEVRMYVNNKSNNTGTVVSNDLAVALQLVNTYVEIINSDTVLERVIEETGLMLETKQVRAMLSAQPVNETEMFVVKITSPNPQMSADIANAVADIAPAEISKIIEGSSAKVIDYARVPTGRYSPSYTLNTITGAVAGGLLVVAFFLVQMLMDTRIKSEADLAKICTIPVLGAIPDFSTTGKKTGKKDEKAGR